jgi:hypothetical protein
VTYSALSVIRYSIFAVSYTRKFFAGAGNGEEGITKLIRKVAVRFASAGYGPIPYWFEMPMEELQNWIEIIEKSTKK